MGVTCPAVGLKRTPGRAETERFGAPAAGAALETVVEFRGETTVVVARSALLDVLRFLKETPALGYTFLADLTAYDDWPRSRASTWPTNCAR